MLTTYEEIYTASTLAMESGADFIKTSTGKTEPAATPEAAFIMAHAIKDYYKMSGRWVGFKPAGGIVTPTEAIVYFLIVKEILGKNALTNQRFRIGASRLANNLLSKIYTLESGEKKEVSYF
jgi:deoxyribose-phosphate aldolase